MVTSIASLSSVKNSWNHDTPDIAGKLEGVLASSGYTRSTIRDYVRTVINMLQLEKKYGTDLVLKYELENLGGKRLGDKTGKSGDRWRGHPIYSSHYISPDNRTERKSDLLTSPVLVYVK